MQVQIRRPFKNEREEIYSLFEKTIQHTLDAEGAGDETELISMLICDQKNLIDADFDTEGKEVYFLVAECSGKLAGTICHRPCSEIITSCIGEKACGRQEIGSVYILPQYQGKGIAKQLLSFMYKTLASKNIQEFYLDSGYAVAKKVWQKILGEPTLIMKDYWGEGVDHHIWHRKLSDISTESSK